MVGAGRTNRFARSAIGCKKFILSNRSLREGSSEPSDPALRQDWVGGIGLRIQPLYGALGQSHHGPWTHSLRDSEHGGPAILRRGDKHLAVREIVVVER